MPNGNPSPTIKENALLLKKQLESFALPRGGYVKIMANMSHLWEELYNKGLVNSQPRILILCTGETARGEYAGGERTALHRVDRNWNVVVMRGHGFKNQVAGGAPMTNPPPTDPEAFYDDLETIRDGCRVLVGISEEYPVNYKGIRPLPNVGPTPAANVFLDASVIEFDTAADIPALDGNGATV